MKVLWWTWQGMCALVGLRFLYDGVLFAAAALGHGVAPVLSIEWTALAFIGAGIFQLKSVCDDILEKFP